MPRRTLTLVAAICGLVAAIAVALPWLVAPKNMTLNQPGREEPTFNGTEWEFKGGFVLVLGILAGFHALLVYLGKHRRVLPFLPLNARQHMLLATVLFLVAFALVLSDALRDFGPDATLGIGLWLAMLATILGAVTAFLSTRGPLPLDDPAYPAPRIPAGPRVP